MTTQEMINAIRKGVRLGRKAMQEVADALVHLSSVASGDRDAKMLIDARFRFAIRTDHEGNHYAVPTDCLSQFERMIESPETWTENGKKWVRSLKIDIWRFSFSLPAEVGKTIDETIKKLSEGSTT
jgi:hypothetical protein